MIKRTIIKTPPQELPSSASKELDKSTKCVGDSCCAQLFIDLVKVFKPLLIGIDSTTSLVASAFVFFVLIISAH